VSGNLIQLDIQSDVDRMVRQMRADTRQVPKAINGTINKVATTIRKEGGQELSKETGLAVNKVKKSLKLKKSTPHTLSASIEARKSEEGEEEAYRCDSQALEQAQVICRSVYPTSQGLACVQEDRAGQERHKACIRPECRPRVS